MVVLGSRCAPHSRTEYERSRKTSGHSHLQFFSFGLWSGRAPLPALEQLSYRETSASSRTRGARGTSRTIAGKVAGFCKLTACRPSSGDVNQPRTRELTRASLSDGWSHHGGAASGHRSCARLRKTMRISPVLRRKAAGPVSSLPTVHDANRRPPEFCEPGTNIEGETTEKGAPPTTAQSRQANRMGQIIFSAQSALLAGLRGGRPSAASASARSAYGSAPIGCLRS